MPNQKIFFLNLRTFVLLLGILCWSLASGKTNEFSDCKECPLMVMVEKGSFELRVPPWGPGHPHDEGYFYKVTFDQPYAIGKYEITVSDWNRCVEAKNCASPRDVDQKNTNLPMFSVSWSDAKKYAKWLSKKTGSTYRLPSNSEWEYAARAGSGMNRYFDVPATELCRYANAYDEIANKHFGSGSGFQFIPCADNFAESAPVGQFLPNKFGIHDMLGNVSEWTEDCASPDWRGAPFNGDAWLDGDCSLRGYRGGSWLNNEPYYLYESDRFRYFESRADDLGFRLVRELKNY